MAHERLRLGEILVGAALVTEHDVADALASQVVDGGRLGTVLVQRGLVSLDDLGRCLAVQHNVPHADDLAFTSIPSGALAVVPKAICAKHLVLPLRFASGELHLAMIDPRRTVVDVVAFSLGLTIRAYVTPELRMLHHLEARCGLQREARYLRLEEGGSAPSDERRKHIRPTIASLSSTPVKRPSTLPFGLLPALSVQPAKPTKPVDSVVARLDAASTGGAIAELLVEPVIDNTAMSVLFWVRGQNAVGCCARGVTASDGELRRMVVSLADPSLFQWAVEVQGAVRAESDSDSIQGELARTLGSAAPGEVCVAPVILRDKVVNIVCIHARPGERFGPEALDELRVVCEQAAMAYQRVGERLKLGKSGWAIPHPHPRAPRPAALVDAGGGLPNRSCRA